MRKLVKYGPSPLGPGLFRPSPALLVAYDAASLHRRAPRALELAKIPPAMVTLGREGNADAR
jgi:hypothetical protein